MSYVYVKDEGDEALPILPTLLLPGESSSVVSHIAPALDSPLIMKEVQSPFIEEVASREEYNLNDITGDQSYHIEKSTSDRCCQQYLEEQIMASSRGSWQESFTVLSPLFCRTIVRPDAYILRHVHNQTVPILLVEVHSGEDFDSTVRKCIFAVIKQLRLYRLYSLDIMDITGFVFPRLKNNDEKLNNKSVIKVTVSRKKLKFYYSLEVIEQSAVSQSLTDAAQTHIALLRSLGRSSFCISQTDPRRKYTVRLSTGELEEFGTNCSQLPSATSILVETTREEVKKIYKYPLDASAHVTGRDVKETPGLQSLPCIVHQSVEDILGQTFFVYDKVLHDPLNHFEASQCLLDFTNCVSTVLDTLHRAGWTHQDVRLPNICFSATYRVVFIDVDRMCKVTRDHMESLKSCMYYPSLNVDGPGSKRNDWRQLGWLIVGVLRPTTDYHGRKFEELPDDIKRDDFLKALIVEGTGPSSCLRTYM